ncbi:hypothetical protein U9M48_018415 [Paspalum notatum var. saurae]|uniref:ARM repeat superfamily protein n=1 Tax=Paspalum notatum var. saurae TaxID=547442 RepID=A0AAQ3TAP1_PASNO
MLILEGLASNHDNCADIRRDSELISKIIGFISYTSGNAARQKAVVCASLRILEDSRSSIKVWEPTMDIIAKLALAEDARQEIGSNRVITGKLMHAFLGRYGPTNMHYSRPLRLVAGEALANLAIESAANCLNLCAHSTDKIRSLGGNEHLSYALPVVMAKMMAVEGKQLETLMGLVSQISNIIPECVIHCLESQLGVSAFVQKMVSALHASKKPSPEYPRMRRVILELTISIIESHPCYTTIFIEKGLMEALTKIESNPSKVEKYRIFLGNAGVVLESGLSLLFIVARAKILIDYSAPTP